MTGPMARPVRVRFAPSPTGDLHIGNVRTALFNWAFARHSGGSFVFRVEDTDRERSTDVAYHAALDTLRWLGLDWDEGPDVGGPFGPYRQSERLGVYADTAARLLADRAAYHCYCLPEEVAARNQAAGRPPGYDGHCRELSRDQVSAYEVRGRRPIVRFRMPPGETTFDDLIRGPVHFDHANVPDFALTRSDGHPLYTLAATTDDVLMQMTHILRGEDLLPSTPRQLAVYAALGLKPDDIPRFGHLPFVMGADNAKLSKRNGEVSIAWYRREGFLPEAIANYLALLGWSIGGDRELFTLAEMAEAFTLERVNANPARFDVKKLEAMNGDKIRGLAEPELALRLLPFLQTAGLVADPPSEPERGRLADAVPLVQTRMARLTEGVDLLRFLFVDEDHFRVAPEAAAAALTPENAPVLEAATRALAPVAEWTTGALQAAVDEAVVAGLGVKKRVAYTPLRVAVTGSRIAPPLFESFAVLGRDRTVARLTAGAQVARAG